MNKKVAWNKGYLNQFCVHGHDIFICGRDSSGRCNDCMHKLHPLKVGKPKSKFCAKGHDKDIVGRTKDGRCKKCAYDNSKNWREHNKEYVKEHAMQRRKEKWKKEKQRLKTDINFRLRTRLRDRIIKAIKNNWKNGSAVKDLGCSIDFLQDYISQKFYNGMTWNNWGSVWELDHIKELHTFDLTDRKQFLEAVNYTNLQPLTIDDHKKKTTEDNKKWRNKNVY